MADMVFNNDRNDPLSPVPNVAVNNDRNDPLPPDGLKKPVSIISKSRIEREKTTSKGGENEVEWDQ